MELPIAEVQAIIDRALAEDIAWGDVTTRALIPPDRRATADAALRAQDIGEQIGEPARNLVDLGEVGRADDKIQASNDRSHAVEIADRLLDPGDDVEPGQPRRLPPLFDGKVAA